ncbi:hypothetical protein WN944_022823 [Citrus x changshan-huyou]|uniref:Uncharacterized protein n=1 Tax=Citrus x changshan-huyou TaxID=2935761 RepID=A0AAP0QWE8_9ROSI
MEKVSFKLTFLVVLMIVAYGTTIFELPSAEAYTGGLPIRCTQDSDCVRDCPSKNGICCKNENKQICPKDILNNKLDEIPNPNKNLDNFVNLKVIF